ncbi:protein kinase domain-containing protein [Gemmata obscuriglobus]|uniref:Protein kinase domain-containing protein n=1 Tax=Gemmata obscuriglobus TaxID=114 RepID=A0A2Z3HK08_9BACT|nr:hypothetical protein [Gemmata obscuriglobus]AWM41800.1 hypothetical protein C1280_35610 [Gemmata obscuriglobus]VTS11592.1 serine threonine protein kinase : Uncultured bacterium genome assembly Metasoil_fosmids_resub OS=uncultured bacterium PE=4 SV=1: Pkinase [Gemmata obscuriglobus UQM 2246]
MGTRAAGPECEPADDPRVVELVKEYEAAWERGRPDRSRFLARHPHLASVVALGLDGIDILYQEVGVLTRADRPVVWAESGLIGARVGEFQVVREIARGGMGVVYEALQPALNRRVALKILPRSLATDRDRLRRFEVEARAAAAVAHPHIVPVYAVGEDRGVNYYAMQFVDGASLMS